MSRPLVVAFLAVVALSTGLAAQSTGQSDPADACPAWRSSTCDAYRRHLAWGRVADPDSVWALLRWIGTRAEAEEWFRLSDPDAREAFLRHFWARRAALVAEEPGERYAEHVRRHEKARKSFALHPRAQLFHKWQGNGELPDIDNAPGTEDPLDPDGDERPETGSGDEIDPASVAAANLRPAWYGPQREVLFPPGRNRAAYPPELDDRGLVFMRAGEPDLIERCGGEVWIYWARHGERDAFVTYFTWAVSSGARITFDWKDLRCRDPIRREYIFQVLSYADARYARLMMQAVTTQQRLHHGSSARPIEASGAEVLSLMRLGVDNFDAAAELSRGERPAAPAYATSLDAQFDFLDFAAPTLATRATEVTLELGLPVERLRVGGVDTRAADGKAAPGARSETPAVARPDAPAVARSDAQAEARSEARPAARTPVPYAVRIALAVTDSAGTVVLRRDTLRTFTAPPDLGEDAVLPFHLTVPLPPGRYTYALRAEGGAAATAVPAATGEAPEDAPREAGVGGVWRGDLVVPELPAPGGALRISSAAIGHKDAANAWRRGGIALGLIPTRVVPPNRKVTLYYELYGLRAGERYRTEIEVEKTGFKLFGRRTRLTLGFDEEARPAADGSVPATRELDLARLDRGDYRVRIKVHRADGGEDVVQETSLTLR